VSGRVSQSVSALFGDEPPTHRTSFGLLAADQISGSGAGDDSGAGSVPQALDGEGGSAGRYYLLLRAEGTDISLCIGRFEIRRGVGILRDYEVCTAVDADDAVALLTQKLPDYPAPVRWDASRLGIPGSIPRLCGEDLGMGLQQRILERPHLSQYWSDDWSTDFYRAQAALGFIATSYDAGDRILLTPELQKHYAVLVPGQLRRDRGVEKILGSDLVRSLDTRLEIDDDPTEALRGLRRAWSDRTWITPPYIDLVLRLADKEEKQRNPGFRIWGVVLKARDCDAASDGLPVAGELGYSIGRTYTSLSGFFRRDRKCWNHFGKLQLHMLAGHLWQRGVDLWNLGHPYMDYKVKLGARITSREEFIPRWNEAVSGAAADISGILVPGNGSRH
jgi:hypothetical protein